MNKIFTCPKCGKQFTSEKIFFVHKKFDCVEKNTEKPKKQGVKKNATNRKR